jgi:hypothetical protein
MGNSMFIHMFEFTMFLVMVEINWATPYSYTRDIQISIEFVYFTYTNFVGVIDSLE